jgi:hypothetical protein
MDWISFICGVIATLVSVPVLIVVYLIVQLFRGKWGIGIL